MSVRVVARVRPLLPKELDKDVIVRVDSSEEGRPPNVVKIPSPKNEAEEFSFTFNSVYDQATTQEELFNAEVAPHIKALFQGLDITLFAYGVTGTGKTHTMRGGMKLADRGVIPRILSHVFRRGKKITKDSDGLTEVDVFLSYYEIYNDKVYDLLEPPEKRTPTGLPLREKDNKTYVVGLSEVGCGDVRDFEKLYVAANQNRVTASTKLNAHSSRSHAILRVKVTQTTRSEDGSGSIVSVRESTASAIDLAGSEDNRRTDNSRERLVESAAINKSLFVLSQCVDAIARGERRIPYRESKMTRILSLGQNNGITVMILNLAPVRSYHLDTLSSLSVSSRAKRIEVREIENEVVFKQLPRSMTMGSASSSTISSTLGSASSSTMSLASTAASSVSSSTSGSGLARQPLRALTSNTHNIQTGNLAAAKALAAADKPDKEKPEKPAKAFMVYTDHAAAKPTAPAQAAQRSASTSSVLPPSSSSTTSTLSSITSSRMGPLAAGRPSLATTKIGAMKSRPSVADSTATEATRTSKLARPSIHPYSASNIGRPAPQPLQAPPPTSSTPMFSAEQIEAIIERKVAEALAAREKEEQLQKQQQDDLHSKRLEALERRIDDTTNAARAVNNGEEDPRAEGLRFLLLARQHKEVGDDAVALHYYEQAVPHFPGQPKLLSKIAKLKAKMARREGSPRKVSQQQQLQALVHQQLQQLQQQPHKRKRAVTAASTALTTPTTPTFRRIGRMGSRNFSVSDVASYVADDVDLDLDVDLHQQDLEADADAEEGDDEDDLLPPRPTLNYASAPEKGKSLFSPSPRRRTTGLLSGSSSRSRLAAASPGRKAAKTSLLANPSSPSGNSDSADADDESFETNNTSVTGSNNNTFTGVIMTPRKQKLLDIVNSRDVARIGGLDGVSARTARGLVAYLERGGGVAGAAAFDNANMNSEDELDGGNNSGGDSAERMSPEPTTSIHHIETLAQLRNVPGMGSETVERAYEGIVATAL